MLAQVLHIGNKGSHSRFFGTTSKIEMHGLRDLLTLVVGELHYCTQGDIRPFAACVWLVCLVDAEIGIKLIFFQSKKLLVEYTQSKKQFLLCS